MTYVEGDNEESQVLTPSMIMDNIIHRITKASPCLPKLGKIVLVIGEAKNRGKWKKAKVLNLIKGRNGVIRVVALLQKEHTIEIPLQAVCQLESRSCVIDEKAKEEVASVKCNEERQRRNFAMNAATKTKIMMKDNESD